MRRGKKKDAQKHESNQPAAELRFRFMHVVHIYAGLFTAKNTAQGMSGLVFAARRGGGMWGGKKWPGRASGKSVSRETLGTRSVRKTKEPAYGNVIRHRLGPRSRGGIGAHFAYFPWQHFHRLPFLQLAPL